jgi:NTP pyrophosphatase (non-canonical NTP hydrolase)
MAEFLCVHPHKPRHSEWLLNEPQTPCEPTTLAVLTDGGWTWMHGVADVLRGRSAQYNVGQRLTEAGLCHEYRIEQHEGGRAYGFPQALLSYGLAIFEERFCIARWIAEHERWDGPGKLPALSVRVVTDAESASNSRALRPELSD